MHCWPAAKSRVSEARSSTTCEWRGVQNRRLERLEGLEGWKRQGRAQDLEERDGSINGCGFRGTNTRRRIQAKYSARMVPVCEVPFGLSQDGKVPDAGTRQALAVEVEVRVKYVVRTRRQ